MTRLCRNKMGCGQSIRKKSKHKVDKVRTDNSNYDKRSHGDDSTSGPGVPSSSSARPQSYDPLTPTSTEEMDTLMAKSSGSVKSSSSNRQQQNTGAIRSKGGGSTQSNGEPWKPKAKDPFQEQMEKSAAIYNQPKGALCSQMKVSNSQAEFFKMLEDKIEKGPDYKGTGCT